jgi:hypothetical protein
MDKFIPFNKEDCQAWKHHNEEVILKMQDKALEMIIRGVLNLHELEHTGEWQQSRRRLDYSKLPFETYLRHHTTWSLQEFRLLEEVVFDHFDELKRQGLKSVLLRLKKAQKIKD